MSLIGSISEIKITFTCSQKEENGSSEDIFRKGGNRHKDRCGYPRPCKMFGFPLRKKIISKGIIQNPAGVFKDPLAQPYALLLYSQ